MARNLIDVVDFRYGEAPSYVNAVTQEFWTINYWDVGKKLAAALTQAKASKVSMEISNNVPSRATGSFITTAPTYKSCPISTRLNPQ